MIFIYSLFKMCKDWLRSWERYKLKKETRYCKGTEWMEHNAENWEKKKLKRDHRTMKNKVGEIREKKIALKISQRFF